MADVENGGTSRELCGNNPLQLRGLFYLVLELRSQSSRDFPPAPSSTDNHNDYVFSTARCRKNLHSEMFEQASRLLLRLERDVASNFLHVPLVRGGLDHIMTVL